MARDPRIDDKIARAAPFARPILEHWRALVHATVPGVEEAIKWGMPHFVYKGKNIAGMAPFKAHCAVMIHGDGARIPRAWARTASSPGSRIFRPMTCCRPGCARPWE
jgi:hypothetical protein